MGKKYEMVSGNVHEIKHFPFTLVRSRIEYVVFLHKLQLLNVTCYTGSNFGRGLLSENLL